MDNLSSVYCHDKATMADKSTAPPWITVLSQASRRRPDWREDSASVFEQSPPWRPLRVVIDVDTVDLSSGPMETLLEGLVNEDHVAAYMYSDNGPPPDLPRSERRSVEGWLTVFSINRDGGLSRSGATWRTENTETSAIVGPTELPRMLSLSWQNSPYAAEGQAAAHDRIERDVIALLAADALGADVYVTNRSYVLNEKFVTDSTHCAAVRPNDALPMIGLFLRHIGRFLVNRDRTFTFRVDASMFYWVTARGLLPSGWRWMSACVQHSQGGDDDRTTWLAGSTIHRVSRALRARDTALSVLCQKQTSWTSDQAVEAIDTIALSLMGALDATAWVAHHTLSPVPNGFPAWQRDRWLKQVRAQVPGLAALTSAGSSGRHVVTVTRLLRNSIHGEALTPLGFQISVEPDDTLIGLPRADTADLLVALDALGGRAAWGVRSLPMHRVYVDMRVLGDRLICVVTNLIDSLMAATPLENWPDVSLKPENALPPVDRRPSVLGETAYGANPLAARAPMQHCDLGLNGAGYAPVSELPTTASWCASTIASRCGGTGTT